MFVKCRMLKKLFPLMIVDVLFMSGCVNNNGEVLDYPFEDKNMFFGLTILKNDLDYELAAELNVSWVSMQPVVIWFFCEPTPGVYNWSGLDEQITKIQELGLDCTPVIYPLNVFNDSDRERLIENITLMHGVLPFLRSENASRFKLYPHNLSTSLQWKVFLKNLVDRYDGDGENDMPGLKYPVRYWHFLEEYPETWLGDVNVYVGLLKMSAPVIKYEDPNAKVVLLGLASNYARAFAFADGFIDDPDAGVFNSTKYTREQIANNPLFQQEKNGFEYILSEGDGYFDVADIHLYEEKLSFMDGKIKWLKSKMMSDKPIWCIEGGGPFKIPNGTSPKHGDPYFGFYTDKENAEFVVKMHVLGAVEGVERFHWSLAGTADNSFWDGPWWVMGLTTYDREKKPSYYTFETMMDFLRDFQSVSRINGVSNGVPLSLYHFETPGGDVYVVWDDSENWHGVDLSWFLNLTGKTVEVTPIITEVDPVTRQPIQPSLPHYGDPNVIPVSVTPVFVTLNPEV
ncbi:MAG TPA: hypothetical protein ENL13_01115 [Thermoplasmatales archaeon]|nr:hypothetical protein [Thermoplasmatales archaeon]